MDLSPSPQPARLQASRWQPLRQSCLSSLWAPQLCQLLLPYCLLSSAASPPNQGRVCCPRTSTSHQAQSHEAPIGMRMTSSPEGGFPAAAGCQAGVRRLDAWGGRMSKKIGGHRGRERDGSGRGKLVRPACPGPLAQSSHSDDADVSWGQGWVQMGVHSRKRGWA